MTQQTKNLGHEGEQQAKKLLKSKGYRFITQNYRTNFGEIDLIFQDNDQLIFVEVKTRTRVEQGMPEEAVNAHKLRQITRVAEHFMQQHQQLPQSGRIDVVSVEATHTPPTLRHLENVSL